MDSGKADRHEEARIGRLCVRLGETRGPLAEAGPTRDLALRIAATVRDRGSSASVSVSRDLDALEDMLLRAGYTAGLSPSRALVPDLPGVGVGHPQLTVLACPAQVCARVEPPDAEAPVCRVLSRPLRRVPLQP
ncbi:hypothetical protein [Saccharomonospora sp. NB11]|uniref:hypothetical protein n=1 Tax=Saccharomonospora sp. NB11 TaxID=1642298 RepID=UPI0018D10CA8|nr:hypothetical protein [Saccharomonospora sp. NB11]